jgi:hypothetical protein
MRELLFAIADMRCLKSLILQNNGIDDHYDEELGMLFRNDQITRIDLSRNQIGKKGAIMIGSIMKDESNHIEWLK